MTDERSQKMYGQSVANRLGLVRPKALHIS